MAVPICVFVFLVTLMGWMPTPVDASAWASVWMQERARQTGHKPTLREALFDFKLGYWGSLITAVMFLSLGALVMFGTGETIKGKGDDFAAQFIKLPYWAFVLAMAAGALLVFQYLTSHMRTLVDFATTVAFLSAPLFGYLNCRVLSAGDLPAEAVPPRWLIVLSWAGLVFLTGFSILFLVMRFAYRS